MTIALGDARTTGTGPDPCAGMVDWGTATGERLTTANDALAVVGALAEDDPTAPAQLDDIAASFGDLAQDQSETVIPPAAISANAALVAAFEAYAAAIDTAARGLEDGDQTILSEAARTVEAARTRYEEADALVIGAIDGCDLTQ